MVNQLDAIHRDPGLPVSRPTQSYWQQPPHRIYNTQSTQLQSEADVVIIGSGITGTSVAYHLLQQNPSFSVTILEARTVTSGATGRNGGHIKDVPFAEFEELKEAFGKEAAIQITKFKMGQIDAILEASKVLSPEEASAAEIRRVETVNAFYNPDQWTQGLARREAWLEDFPEERARYGVFEGEEAQKKFGMPGVIGCMTHPAGAIWPYRFVTAMLSKLIADNPKLSLETTTPVTEISNSESADFNYRLTTPRGTIMAKHVVHCTNGHVAHLLPSLQGKVFPMRGQMTVQSPSASFPRLGSQRSWSLMHDRGFDYMTQSPSADGTIYLGGGFMQAVDDGSHEVGSTSDNECSEAALDHLKVQIQQHFDGGADTKVISAWSGVMGFTPDMLPVVGRVEDAVSGRTSKVDGGEWIAAGFCGHGMAYCWSSGDVIARLMTGKEESLKGWFPSEVFACTQERLARCTDDLLLAWLSQM